MGVQRTGGFIGRRAVPSIGGASGIWQLGEAESAVRDGIWPTTRDPYWSSVVALLHGDGANNSTTIVDSSSAARTYTAFGDARISSASKIGSGAIFLDGSGDYVRTPHSTDLDLGTGDFTIECWIYPTSVSATRVIASKWNSGGTNAWLFYFTGGSLYMQSVGNTFVNRAASAITANTWTNVAAVRSSGTVTLFANGISLGSGSLTASMSGTSPVLLGANDGGANYFAGYIDEFRLTKAARYSANYTPTATAYPEQ